jgi:hypothetical protein
LISSGSSAMAASSSSSISSLLMRTLADKGIDLASWISSSICWSRAVMSIGG